MKASPTSYCLVPSLHDCRTGNFLYQANDVILDILNLSSFSILFTLCCLEMRQSSVSYRPKVSGEVERVEPWGKSESGELRYLGPSPRAVQEVEVRLLASSCK